jgi:hypothetical protein
MFLKPIVSIFALAATVTVTACGDGGGDSVDGCTGHLCVAGDSAVTDAEGGNIIFEYIYFDTELQAAFHLPSGVTTANRIMAYFMNAQTPDANKLPDAGKCNNLQTTNGWPQFVGTPHTDLDIGTLTITGQNTAGKAVSIDVPKMPAGRDSIGRPHDLFYQIIQPSAPDFLKPNSSYTVKLGGSDKVPATTLTDALFLAQDFTVNSPDLEGNGPMKAGVDFPVKWTPAVSSALPPAAEEVGGIVLGVTWLVDATGAPTHICPVDHASGQFTIPGSAITEYKAAAVARGQTPNKVILLRNAIVHRLARLPNGDKNNKRRIDMLTVLCWAQLMDVE